MLELITINTYTIKYIKDADNPKKFAFVAEFDPVSDNEIAFFGNSKVKIPLLKNFGFENYLKDGNMKEDDALIVIGAPHNAITQGLSQGYLAFPCSYLNGSYGEYPEENPDVKQILNTSDIKDTEYKIIRSENGENHLAISNNGIEITAGKNKFVISSDGIMETAKRTQYTEPGVSYGVVKDNGIISMIPSTIVTLIPNLLPNPAVINSIIKIQKTVADALKASKGS